MAIINFTIEQKGKQKDTYATGAYCSLNHRESGVLILWETYQGRCISERERNGYDDSDFYMTVWDDELGKAYETMFATTRFWSYPAMGSYVDATPEVMEKYEAWKQEQHKKAVRHRHRQGLKKRHEKLKAVVKAARKNDLKVGQVKRIASMNDYMFEGCMKLLTSNLRSDFRKSLKTQLIEWLTGENEYDSPFSPRQSQYL